MEGNASHESSQDEFDEHLAAELEKGLGEDDSDSSKDEEQDDDEGGSDSDMGGLFGGANASEEENILPGQEDEDEEESPAKAEARRRARLLADEIRDLETTIKKKNVDLAKQTNPILKVGLPFHFYLHILTDGDRNRTATKTSCRSLCANSTSSGACSTQL